MSFIHGNGFVQTSMDVKQKNGCRTVTIDGYHDDNCNGKLDKNEKFSSCTQTVCY
ncbi:hypothetical protein [Chryseobacterium taihuense]|nr:hypothetical protein [Chryseobacterium taihuense]